MLRTANAGAPAPRQNADDDRRIKLPPVMAAKSVITFAAGGPQLRDHGFYEISGHGQGVDASGVSTDGGASWKQAPYKVAGLVGMSRRRAHSAARFDPVASPEPEHIINLIGVHLSPRQEIFIT